MAECKSISSHWRNGKTIQQSRNALMHRSNSLCAWSMHQEDVKKYVKELTTLDVCLNILLIDAF